MPDDRIARFVTCLGCGCTCDDITLVIRQDRIAETHNACPRGAAWFGDGRLPARARVQGTDGTLEQAVAAMAERLVAASRPLIYVAADLSVEAQRHAIALADLLHARLDNLSSDTARAGILAAQARGRAGVTLGEILNRADLLIYWGVDPAERYTRFNARYAVEPRGLHTPDGRGSRTIVAVDLLHESGGSMGPPEADLRVGIPLAEELAALTALRTAQGSMPATAGSPLMAPLLERIGAARYAVLIVDGEPGTLPPRAGRAEALIALSQAMNRERRAALLTLRGGGNRGGAEAAFTWQTGFPLAVSFTHGAPRYAPMETAATLLAERRVDLLLIAGSMQSLPDEVTAALGATPHLIVGPRASESESGAVAAIDTGTAGIHEGGTAFRLDDVPLPLAAPLQGMPQAAQVLRSLVDRTVQRHLARARLVPA